MAIAALKGDETLVTLAERFDVHPNRIRQWKVQLLENASDVFATNAERMSSALDLKDLHGKIGQQALEIDFDEPHLESLFAGARMLRDMLRLEEVQIGRKHVSTLMKKMGIEALYRSHDAKAAAKP